MTKTLIILVSMVDFCQYYAWLQYFYQYLHRWYKQQIFPVKIENGSTKSICSQNWFHRRNFLLKYFLKIWLLSQAFLKYWNFEISIFWKWTLLYTCSSNILICKWFSKSLIAPKKCFETYSELLDLWIWNVGKCCSQ